MASGHIILILLFLFVFLGILLGIYCHFCGETYSGGRYFGSNENLGAQVVYATGTKQSATSGPRENKPVRSKCRCSNKFKGYCKACEGDDFVDDGKAGHHPNFSDYGGDRGLDPNWGNNPDPIRSALGNGSTDPGMGSTSGGGGYGDSGMMSDQ